jgi:acyl-CoA synthetase (AMP-forming)/AMP-acid ligase II
VMGDVRTAAGDLVIGAVFRGAARAHPHRTAVVIADESRTFGEIDAESNQIARALEKLGLRRGDRMAVWSSTRIEMVTLFAALAKLGVVFVPINPGLSDDEIVPILAKAQPAALAVDLDRLARGGSLRPSECGLVLIEPAAAAPGHHAEADLVGLAAIESEKAYEGPPVSELDVHTIFFTSGTTGGPKGAMLSHRVNVLRSHPGSQLEPRGSMVCPYPLFHMGAWTIALQQWQARDCVIFTMTADASEICGTVQKHQAERLNGIPAVWRRILDHASPAGDGQRPDLSSIRFADSGTSATPPELLAAIAAALPGAAIRIFYGSTEAGNVASLDPADIAQKPGTCGVPSPLAEVRVSPEGELQVCGPLLFDGYFGDPVATAAAHDDGWYRTGDLVAVDAEGYLTVVGRVSDAIRTGGETVAPIEVEAVVGNHPGIADTAVVGIPDAQWGEIVCAVVVMAAGAEAITIAELRDHCRPQLAKYKQPRRLEIVDAIPRTAATGQVQRRLLVERIAQQTVPTTGVPG